MSTAVKRSDKIAVRAIIGAEMLGWAWYILGLL
jgi:hypothetical protein